MIVLDTNVVSEPMRLDADAKVLAWLDAQEAETLFLTATSLSELLVGVATLPEGKRKKGLDTKLGQLIATLFGARVLPFDASCAVAYAGIVGRARAAGRAISVADGQIASIAAVHGFAVATRDGAPFKAAGVPVIDPWDGLQR